MTKLPQISGDRLVRALRKAGFYVHHQKGSHVTMKRINEPSLRIIVPVHKGKVLKPGLLMSIIKDARITIDYLKELI